MFCRIRCGGSGAGEPPALHIRLYAGACEHCFFASGAVGEADAQRIWNAVEQLYRNDPAATDILLEIKKARGP